MGQTKNRNRLLPEHIIAECEILEATRSTHTDMVLHHIATLNFDIIPRWSAAEEAGMIPLACHDNAIGCELRNSGTNRIKAVHGWWRRGHCFIFHSVVSVSGELSCVTPVICDQPDQALRLEFARDPWIERETINGKMALTIFGERVPPRISLNPDYDRKLAAAMRERVAAGMDPELIARENIIIS